METFPYLKSIFVEMCLFFLNPNDKKSIFTGTNIIF